jgi:surface antigen
MAPVLLAACSMSGLGGNDTPETTGSIAPAFQVQQPLPPTLAYSDANKIGEAASAAIAQAGSAAPEDWVNNSTGSSGTIEAVDLAAPADSSNCRPFSTIVTSIGGVHRYSGEVCQGGNGRALVQIDEASKDDRT